MIKEFIQRSALRILEGSSEKGLGRGNLGVLVARAGVGKTACLIHIAFDTIFRDGKVVHVSLQDGPDKISSYYNVILSELLKVFQVRDDRETRSLVEKNRMILAYLNQSFDLRRLKKNLKNLSEKADFQPNALVVDGLDFSKTEAETFEVFKNLAREYGTEIWFSALSHRHIADASGSGIPYPCNRVENFFNVVLELEPANTGIRMKVLKNHTKEVRPEDAVLLDPSTFLTMG
ncbi:MAG: hypothetical protein JW836_13470 [Deltaproteobacteria bacterium]|nr:hypothetical protein [Deltaproteobacteria bacterium]